MGLGPTIFDTEFQFHKAGGEVVSFEISNEDTDNATYKYYGYISSSGSWIIMRQQIAAGGKIYKYYAGQDRDDYDDQWDATSAYIGVLTFVTFDLVGALL
jgi:hypothetical protein